MTELSGRRVVVMGLGLFGGGVGATRFLCGEGARVTVTDLRAADELAASVARLEGLPVTLKLGGHDEVDFAAADLIVANPAVPRHSPYLRAAEGAGVPVTTEICLFVERCVSRILGVTGSSGKTTTTSVTAAMLRGRWPGLTVGGNVGVSLLDRLDGLRPDVPVLLELSSFQLDRLGEVRWRPDVAVVTNFAPNHLDVHGSLAAYRHAKQQVLRWQTAQDVAVLNGDDAEVATWAGLGDGRVLLFHTNNSKEEGVCLADGRIVARDASGDRELASTDDVRVPGRHNLANAAAACAAADAMGASPDQIRGGLRGFGGIEHRLERVADVAGAVYYNDSIATSPDRTCVALEALAGRLILIAGGSDKGLSYAGLGSEIARRTSDAILMGATADRIAAAIPEGAATRIHRADGLEEAVEMAQELAGIGSTVLLSPASASFDQFANFEQRGQRYKELIENLKRRQE